jgi:hypothetical protein
VAETGIVLRKQELDDLAELGHLLISSGFFKDSGKVAQAAVKVLAGRELGLGPIASMRSFHIVENKIEMSADLMAQRVKAHPKYDYRVAVLTDEKCSIRFFEDGDDDELGTSIFSMEDARRAGLVKPNGAWVKYPRNMLFARAMSNGIAWFCPDVAAGGRLYVDGEISGYDQEQDPELPSSAPLVDPETGEILEDVAEMATDAQLRHLFALAHELDLDDDARHALAGVESFKELTKARASELIEDWIIEAEVTKAREERNPRAENEARAVSTDPFEGLEPEGAEDLLPSEPERSQNVAAEEEGSNPTREGQANTAGTAPPSSAATTDPDAIATPEQRAAALRHFGGSKAEVCRAVAKLSGISVTWAEITHVQMEGAILARLDRKV